MPKLHHQTFLFQFVPWSEPLFKIFQEEPEGIMVACALVELLYRAKNE
jgi:hypothetical protein